MPLRLAEARASYGREVIYTPPHGEPTERGEITSANEEFVFVRYEGSWQPKATNPMLLDFA